MSVCSKFSQLCFCQILFELFTVEQVITKVTSSSAIAERPRCRVGQLWPKVEDCKWETTLYGHYRSVFNHYDVLASKAIEFGEKTQKKAMTPLKVIQGHRGRYQSKARMRFPISD